MNKKILSRKNIVIAIIIVIACVGTYKFIVLPRFEINKSSAAEDSGCENVPGGRARRSCLAAYYDCISEKNRRDWGWNMELRLCESYY